MSKVLVWEGGGEGEGRVRACMSKVLVWREGEAEGRVRGRRRGKAVYEHE